MRCQSCDSELLEDTVFCTACGGKSAEIDAAVEMAELARTEGLVAGRRAPGVPDIPEAAPIPERAPAIPAIAELPDAPRISLQGAEVAMTETVPADVIASARLRELKRREAQSLIETAQSDLLEELADAAAVEAAEESPGYDLGDAFQRSRMLPEQERSPRPPPPPAGERAQARRATESTSVPTSAYDEETVSPATCLVTVVITMMLLLLMALGAGLLIEFLDEEQPEAETAALSTIYAEVECRTECARRPVKTAGDGLMSGGHLNCETREEQTTCLDLADGRPINDVLHGVRNQDTRRCKLLPELREGRKAA